MPHSPHCIAFYCGSANGHNLTYKSAISEIVEQLAARNISVVYGGGNIGLMGVLGDAATAHGLHITGIIPRSLVDREIAHPGLTELEVVDTMAQRKTRMEQLADTYIALPGGVGTLEELSEVLTLQQLGEITGPIVLYNIDGFWIPFVYTLQHMCDAGFINPKYIATLIVVDNPDDLFAALERWHAPGEKWGD
ncbi:TIGR00730 family Rossman fold protein [Corynebacterium durum]|uniref:LOG family protein n=1 Tax=Corynebacterium durum TaxID=61592 RepID=UPI003608BFBB